jgi:hypothetical protein
MHRTVAILLAAAPLAALADTHCGTIQPNSKTANYQPAVRMNTETTTTTLSGKVMSATVLVCPPNYFMGPELKSWCCPNGDSINEVAEEAVACCPCGADCGDYFPTAFGFSTSNGGSSP